MSLASRFSYVIRAHEVDRHWRLSLPSLLHLMHEAAWQNTLALDAAIPQLHARGITWAMVRLRLEMTHYPRQQEEIWVESWPSGGDRGLVYRDYRLYDANQQPIGQATSTWLVLDLETRRMQGLPADLAALIEPPAGFPPLPRASGRLRPPAEPASPRRFAVRWHDLDPNGHVNNVLYAQWAAEALPEALLNQQRLRLLDLVLRAECTYHDVVLSAAGPAPEPGAFLHTITRESDQKLLAQARSVWEPRPDA